MAFREALEVRSPRLVAGAALMLLLMPYRSDEPGAATFDVATVEDATRVSASSIETERAPAPSANPIDDSEWHGICHEGEIGWPDMPITLSLYELDGELHATGTLAFYDRRTRATLHGPSSEGRVELHGQMREVGGIDTVWRIEARVQLIGEDRLRGYFIEHHHDGGSARMCTFDWRR